MKMFYDFFYTKIQYVIILVNCKTIVCILCLALNLRKHCREDLYSLSSLNYVTDNKYVL